MRNFLNCIDITFIYYHTFGGVLNMELVSFTKGTEDAKYVNKLICTEEHYVVKQIEHRNGRFYMRLKKRAIQF